MSEARAGRFVRDLFTFLEQACLALTLASRLPIIAAMKSLHHAAR